MKTREDGGPHQYGYQSADCLFVQEYKNTAKILGKRQITDAYIDNVAVAMGANSFNNAAVRMVFNKLRLADPYKVSLDGDTLRRLYYRAYAEIQPKESISRIEIDSKYSIKELEKDLETVRGSQAGITPEVKDCLIKLGERLVANKQQSTADLDELCPF